MTREEAIDFGKMWLELQNDSKDSNTYEFFVIAIEALKQQPRKGEWLRMSDLSESEDDRYKCSRCGDVIHHRDKMNLYTFNSWCGRCGSDNGRKLRDENDK